MCFATGGMSATFGNRRRQSLRDVFQGIVQRAGSWPADALLIAGDLFEGDRVTQDTVAFLKAEFASIPDVSVFISPGNHDPWVPSSPYSTETWPANVTVFKDPRWSAVPVHEGRLVVHGFAFDGPDISSNPFGALRIDDPGGAVHVAVGHGSERSHQPPDKALYAPFTAASAAAPGLRYLALGHFHGMLELGGDFTTRIWYSGSPEGHSFRETGEHSYLEIECADGNVRVNPVPSSRVIYETGVLPCDDFQSTQEVVQALRAMASKFEQRVTARVTLTGSMPVDMGMEIDGIHDAVDTVFEHLDLVDSTLPTEDYEALARQRTSLGLFVRTLNEEISDNEEESRVELLLRARELGVAAFRNRSLPVRGTGRTGS